MGWTKEQIDAIEKRGTSIIVSAGAGSGKTAVLSERVLKEVLDNIPVDRLLILTFTKLAAGEMKERIKKKIKSNNLVDQLRRLDNAYITTFDSFSLSIVKKYHYLLNVNNNVDIIDENILNVKKYEFLNEILDSYYINPTDNFNKFMNDFCIKSDNTLINTIININNSLDMKSDKQLFLKEFVDNYYNINVINNNVDNYIELIKNKINEIKILLVNLNKYCDIDYSNKINDSLYNLFNCKDYISIKNEIELVKLPSKPRNSDFGNEFKKIKDSISDKISNIKELCNYEDKNDMIETILNTKDYIKLISEIILKLDNKLNNYKYNNNLFTFNDIAKMAIKVVKENEDVRLELINSFDEILLDEYQDTNDIQEEFMSLIQKNNIYCVGDIKQSIYRFRNANPKIFENKLESYYRIDLLKNFRSRKEVLDNINLIFKFIMDKNIGGAEYINGHEMNYGNTSYDTKDIKEQNYNMEILTYNEDEIKKLKYSRAEIEAFTTGTKIKEMIDNHYRIFDKDNNTYSDCKYSDFAIINATGTNFSVYKKVFDYLGIPINIYLDEELTQSSLLLVIKNIFKLLDVCINKKDKSIKEYCFMSIGRSFLYNYKDDYLFNLIQNNNIESDNIFININKILENINNKTISMILDEIIEYFDIYNKLIKVKNIKDEYIKLDYLYDLASNLNNMEYNYLEFSDLIDSIINNKDQIKFSLSKEGNNSVKLLNIHKSKGLEYPVCFFNDLDKKFNVQDLNDKFLYSNDLGIISPVFNEGIDTTFYKELYKENYYNEEVSEKIRLFYVALTRAKEKIFFVTPEFNEPSVLEKDIINGKEKKYVNDFNRKNYRRFYDMLNSINDQLSEYIYKIDLDNINLSSDYLKSKEKDVTYKEKNKLNVKDNKLIEKIQLEEKHYSKSNIELITKDKKELLELGTKLHYYLEILDFNNPDYSKVEDKYINLVKSFIDSIDKKDCKYYKEYEFIYNKDNIINHGIIDLLIEYKDKIIIYDYKTKNIDSEYYINQLNGYKEYIKLKTNKIVKCYLYSLVDKVFKEV